MNKYKHYECTECEGIFKIKHEMESDYYNVVFCPFCGADIDEDQEDDYNDEDSY